MKKLKHGIALFLALAMLMTAALSEEQIEVLTDIAPAVEAVAQEPMEEPEAQPVEEPVEEPAQEPIEEFEPQSEVGPTEEPAQETSTEIAEGQTEEPSQEPTQEPAQEPLPAARLAEELGLTLEELAEQMGMDVDALCQLDEEALRALCEQASDIQTKDRPYWEGNPLFTVVDGFVIQHNRTAEGEVVEYIGYGGNVTVPEGWEGGTVTSVADNLCYADYSGSSVRSIDSITFPKTIKRIGSTAFWGCGLTNVQILGDDVDIGGAAFAYCGYLRSANITGDNVKLGSNLFWNDASLQSVSITGANASLEELVFMECVSLEKVELGEGITELPRKVFAYCDKLRKIDLPSTIKIIGEEAFLDCYSLETLTLPAGVTEIGDNAFSDNTTLIVTKGSYAERYCVKNGYTYRYNDGTGPSASEPSSVTVSPSEVTLIVGQTQQLTRTVEPADADQSVTFKSDNNEVATVSPEGEVLTLAKGSATITVETSNGKKATCKVTVVEAPKPPTSVKLDKATLSLALGQSAKLTATVTPSDAVTELKWESSDEKVATVSDGTVTAIAPGKAAVTVKTNNYEQDTPELMATCEVTVLEQSASLILPEALTLGKGETYTLKPEIEGGGSATFDYKSSDTKTVKVSKKGKLTAVATGTATITVTANGLSGNCTVTVVKAPSKVTLSSSKATLGVGESFEITATLPSGTASKLTASSSKATIAAIRGGEAGKFTITAKKAGSATITVKTFNNKSAKFTVTVKNAPTAGKLTITPAAQTLAVSQTVTLKAKFAKGFGGSYRWSSGDESKASVTEAGVVTALAAGDVTVAATSYNGVAAECKLTIEPAAEEVVLNETELTLGAGEKFTLEPTAMAGEARVTAATFTYTSDNKSVAKVSKAGKITAVKVGTAKITVETDNGKSAACTVTVVKAPGKVTLSAAKATLGVGESTEFTAALPEGTASRLTTSSTRASVATITQTEPGKFKIEAKKKGTTTITVRTFNGKTAKFNLTVK